MVSKMYRFPLPLSVSQSLSEVVGSPTMERQLLPFLLRLAKDPVPNVRFNVAKAFERLLPCLERGVLVSQVRPCLEALSRDSDTDVRYYSGKTLALSS